MEEPVIYERVSGVKLGTIQKAPECSEGITFSRKEETATGDAIKKQLIK